MRKPKAREAKELVGMSAGVSKGGGQQQDTG